MVGQMARESNKLTAVAVARMKAPGVYSDGLGLYLQVGPTGAKSWLFRYMRQGKAREMGLGPVHTVSLSEARVRAGEHRRTLLDGRDPLEERRKEREAVAIADASTSTFRECAEALITAMRPGWRNAKHAAQWSSTLQTYAYPIVGDLPVSAVDTGLVLRIIETLWLEHPETATRLRSRVERVLDYATTRGFRSGDNPARWRGHLDNLLPKRTQVAKVEHHPALPFAEVGAFMKALRAIEGTAARALEFTILTAARTSEVTRMQWAEVDKAAGVWTVPGERMKAGREHRVPLSVPTLAVLEGMSDLAHGAWVFPGQRGEGPLSNMSMLMLLRRMKREDITVHGFRSTFRDWVAERTNYPRDLAEMALAHTISDKVEAAYRRGDMFDKRRRLMDAWAAFCGTSPEKGEVIPIKKGGREAAA